MSHVANNGAQDGAAKENHGPPQPALPQPGLPQPGLPQPGLPQQSQMQENLVEHFAAATGAVLSQIAGSALQAQPATLDTATEAATLMRIEISGALEGLCEIALSAAMTAQFAALLTGEPCEPEGNVSGEAQEAAAELIQQICGNAADRLRAHFGPMELKPRLAEREADSSIRNGTQNGTRNGTQSSARHRLCITRSADEAEGGDALELELHILRLAAPAGADAPSAQPSTEALAQSTPQALSPAPAESAVLPSARFNNRNLDLLLDIELGVTLRFGSRQMLLKDILELSSGSVVELDRRVEEPVDLLIDGRIIAQGEVVIIGGNYGLRILQVATQGEKLACLP